MNPRSRLERFTADEVIRRLDLQPHPEGGYFRETFRHRPPAGERGALTQIYYLLRAGAGSAWHRIDAIEVWHYYAGAPLRLRVVQADGGTIAPCLGGDLATDTHLHYVIAAGCWQSAETLGAWSLVGCTVAPAFEFAGFELAPRGWAPESHGHR